MPGCGSSARRLCTFVLGAYIAIFQHDLKGLLAYSTISHLGLITLLLGLNSPLAAVAAIFHIMNHATFKASLFMGVGVIDHETGTRDIRRLSGLYRFMPISATLAIVAAAAMAGVPLLNGFLSKEMFFSEALEVEGPFPALDPLLPYIATFAGMFSVAYSLRFIHGVFFGSQPTDLPREPHEAPPWMRFPIELLVVACVVVGVFPNVTIGPFLDVAAHAVLGSATPEYSLALWHGLTLPLVMSLLSMTGGTLFYVLLYRYLTGGKDGYRCFQESMPDASSIACWSRCPGAGPAGSRRFLVRGGCSLNSAGWWRWSSSPRSGPSIDMGSKPGKQVAPGSMWCSRSSGSSAEPVRWARHGKPSFTGSRH